MNGHKNMVLNSLEMAMFVRETIHLRGVVKFQPRILCYLGKMYFMKLVKLTKYYV